MQRGDALPGVQSLSPRHCAGHDAHLAGAIGALMSGARYEIAIDGTARTHRDREDYALEAATFLKSKQPNAEITVRDLQAGTVTAIEHRSNR
jgi:hypothetical protein